ncbi:DUF5801 repeats-in-toxin domain-containing protein [Pseudomonas knackmussii]|uniref:T1SS-143 repeat domain-containing protein n=1 Tax=Pseudomonas knackmussii TaxID=65741 RepID=UPI003F4A48AA
MNMHHKKHLHLTHHLVSFPSFHLLPLCQAIRTGDDTGLILASSHFPLYTPSVTSDQSDYAPGSTALFTASGIAAGSTVEFKVQHAVGAGADNVWGTPDDVLGNNSGAGHEAWFVTDGGPGDLDGKVNGSVTTSWYVNPDDSAGATFLLSATTAGADGAFGTADDSTATASFTDSTPGVTATGVTVSIDETAGLQNSTATPSPAEDANDNDILVTSLPTAFTTRLTGLGAGAPARAALSGYTGAAGNTGSDAFTLTPPPGGSITGVAFTDSLGAALNGLDSGLTTLDGTHILLYTDSSDNNILLGRAGSASGAIVFAAYIQETGSPPTGGKIWTVEYQPLQHPDATNPDDAVNLLNKVYIGTTQDLTFSLANAPSGQNLFLMFTTATPHTETVGGVVRITDPAIIATGKDPANQSTGVNINTGDTINTSQAGGPTTFGTNNQMITEQEGIRFTFVTGARQNVTIPNLDQNEADVEANIDFTGVFMARTASFDIVQLQSGKSAVVKISALNTAAEPGVNFVDGYGNDSSVAITNVRVINNATGQVIENSNGSVNDPSIVITISGGIATITGVKAGYKIEYTTSADHDRVLIENGAALNASGNTHADFDIGGFKLVQVSNTTAEIGSKMIFEDDGPSATGTPVAGTVDEDGLTNGIAGGVGDVTGEATTATGSVTGIFQSGADTPLTYSLATDTSGLPALSSGGVALVYSVSGNTLTATAGAGGATVFTLSLTSAGNYTFTLLKPLDHPAGNDENDITINLGTLLKATDYDGDSVTAAADKLVITVDDDTPTAAGTPVAGTVDEDGLTNGIAGGVGDVAGEETTATGSITGIFQSGADTPLTYSLSTDTSGLPALSSGGVALVYSVSGNTLTATAGAGGATVFTLSLTSAGNYTFTLLKPLDHPAGNDENDITINLGTLLKATDKDGDFVTAAADKLVITVDDDTPTATGTPVAGTVDEDGLTNGIAGGVGDVAGEETTATGSITGIFQSGADTPLTYSLSTDTSGLPALSSGGVALVYSVSGNTLTATAGAGGATVFTLSLTSAGNYTFTLLKPLDHPAGNDENDITINLGTLLKATDKDGDFVTAAADKLVITVDDDTPTAAGTPVAGTIDEDGLANGIAGGVGDVAGEETTATGSITGIFQSGADAPLTYSLATDTSGLPALSSGGVALVYSVSGNTLTAKAGVGGADVFTLSVTATGDYTFTLLKPLDHPTGNDENDITINLGTLLKATDYDGDTVTAAADKLVITVDDDTPTAAGTPVAGTVDEDGLANGIAGGVGDVAGEETTATGSITGIFQSGADAPLTYSLATDTSGLPALSSGGVALVYSVSGNTLTAKAGVGGADVFTLSVTATGDYTFTLLKPLDHPTGNDENDITINLGTLLKATDYDGDTVTAAADKLVITVDDDTPTAAGTPVAGTVDEDGLANGIAGGVGDVAGEETTATGSITGIFQSGADTPLTYSLSTDTSGLPALSSGGVALVYSVSGNTLTAKAGVGGADVFTLSVTATGDYTFTLLKPLDHPAGNDENDITINLGTLLKATDYDGDSVTAAADKLVITVDDDTPTAAGTPVAGTVDEDGLTNGIAGGVGDVTGEATTATGSVTGIFQSGADTPLTYSLATDTSGLPALSSGGVALVYSVSGNTLTATAGAGGATVFTLSLTSAGNYTFTLLKPLDHPAGNDENDITINLGTLLKATDYDGDSVTAAADKLVITVDDDTPTAAGTPVAGTVDEDGLTNGIAGGVGDVAGEETTATGSITGIFQSGADTPLTYSLSTDTSGLPALSSGGVALVYSVSGNTLTATAGAGGATVFTLSLTSAGNYTFTLLKPLDHPAGNDENDITINLGTLLKATDYDGDSVTAAADKLVITVDDDTPTAAGTPVAGTVDEDGLANGIAGGVGDVAGEETTATGSITGIFQSGADTPLTYSLSTDTSGLPALSSGGVALVYSVSGNTLTAKAGVGGADVFTLSVTATGDYTFTLLKPLDHPAGNDENDITINLGTLLKATDYDGDSVTAAADKLVITVDDDTPTAAGTPVAGTVDEDGLANGIAGGVGDVAGEETTATGSITGIFQSGADTPLTYSLSTDTSGLPALSSGGVALVYSVSGNILTAKAGVGGATVFTLSLTSTGDYTFTLLKPLDHPAGNNENDITINLGTLLKATDYDGDSVTAAADKLVITVDDDTPTAAGTPVAGTVDEDGLANGIAGGVGDVAGEETTATGSITGIFQSGADTPLTYSLATDTSGLQALSSGGVALVYSVSGNILTAKAGVGGATVFTLSLTSTGDYTFTLLKPLDHPAGNNENDITINLGTLLKATDYDGDSVTAAADKLVITVDDDTPTLAFGNLVGTGSILPQIGFWNMGSGADGLGAAGLDISLVNNQFTLVRPDNTTTTGTGTLTEDSVSPDANGAYHFSGTLTGDFDNNAATANTTVHFTLTANADGTYALDLVEGFKSTLVLSSADGSLDAGGPDPVRTLTIGTESVVFFAADPLAPQTGPNSILTGVGVGASDPTEADLQTNPLPSYIGTAAMNVSTSGIGIANNNLEGNNTAGINAGDESFVINPQTLLTAMKVFIDNSLQGYDPSTEELYYTIYYEDGTTSGAPKKVLAADLHAESGGQQSFLVQWDGTHKIDAVQLIMGKGAVKIPVIQFIQETENLASDIQLAFNATVTDKDGDSATSSFTANLAANEVSGSLFDYTLAGTTGVRDSFNVDLSATESKYQITGFDAGAGQHDTLVLNGDQNAVVQSIDNSGANSIVTVHESGGQNTIITLVGVDVQNSDIVFGSV